MQHRIQDDELPPVATHEPAAPSPEKPTAEIVLVNALPQRTFWHSPLQANLPSVRSHAFAVSPLYKETNPMIVARIIRERTRSPFVLLGDGWGGLIVQHYLYLLARDAELPCPIGVVLLNAPAPQAWRQAALHNFTQVFKAMRSGQISLSSVRLFWMPIADGRNCPQVTLPMHVVEAYRAGLCSPGLVLPGSMTHTASLYGASSIVFSMQSEEQCWSDLASFLFTWIHTLPLSPTVAV